MANRIGMQVTSGERIGAAAQVMEFCLRHGKKLFVGWPDRTLFIYCFFHLAQRTCFTCRARGKISAVMFGWGMPVAELMGRNARGEPIFCWRVSDDEADGIFVAEVITEGPSRSGLPSRAGHRSLKRMMALAALRWPDWRRKRVFTCRRGRLHELRLGVIGKIENSG